MSALQSDNNLSDLASLTIAKDNLALTWADVTNFAAGVVKAVDTSSVAFAQGINSPSFTGTFVDSGSNTFGGFNVAHRIGSNDNGVAHTTAQGTMAIVRSASASFTNGPANSDFALFISNTKPGYLTTPNDGELDGLWVQVNQGAKGDGGGIDIGVAKVSGGTGGGTPIEIQSQWVAPSTGAVQNQWHTILGFMEGAGGPSGSTGYGAYTESQIGNQFSAYHVSKYGGNWAWAFTLYNSRAAGDQLFGIDGNGLLHLGVPTDKTIIGYSTATHTLVRYDATGTTNLNSWDSAGNAYNSGGIAVGASTLIKKITQTNVVVTTSPVVLAGGAISLGPFALAGAVVNSSAISVTFGSAIPSASINAAGFVSSAGFVTVFINNCSASAVTLPNPTTLTIHCAVA